MANFKKVPSSTPVFTLGSVKIGEKLSALKPAGAKLVSKEIAGYNDGTLERRYYDTDGNGKAAFQNDLCIEMYKDAQGKVISRNAYFFRPGGKYGFTGHAKVVDSDGDGRIDSIQKNPRFDQSSYTKIEDRNKDGRPDFYEKSTYKANDTRRWVHTISDFNFNGRADCELKGWVEV
jgi:hypothetical protein